MNPHQKRAGQSTREMAARRYKNRVWFVLGTVSIVLLILLASFNSEVLGIGGMGVLGLWIAARVIINYSEARTRRMVKEEKRAIRGAKGEETVGSILEKLGEDYMVIHDVTSPYGNIDHIVLSRQGSVFLLETKAHGGKVAVTQGHLLVNGKDPEKDFIAQTLNNTYWLKTKIQDVSGIETWVHPILVFTNAFVERMDPIKGVTIINKKFLLRLLQRPGAKAQNPAVWESREKIETALCA